MPAPESNHAEQAWPSTRRSAAKSGEARPVILFNLSGHGHFDLAAYERYLSGKLEDYEYEPTKEAA